MPHARIDHLAVSPTPPVGAAYCLPSIQTGVLVWAVLVHANLIYQLIRAKSCPARGENARNRQAIGLPIREPIFLICRFSLQPRLRVFHAS